MKRNKQTKHSSQFQQKMEQTQTQTIANAPKGSEAVGAREVSAKEVSAEEAIAFYEKMKQNTKKYQAKHPEHMSKYAKTQYEKRKEDPEKYNAYLASRRTYQKEYTKKRQLAMEQFKLSQMQLVVYNPNAVCADANINSGQQAATNPKPKRTRNRKPKTPVVVVVDDEHEQQEQTHTQDFVDPNKASPEFPMEIPVSENMSGVFPAIPNLFTSQAQAQTPPSETKTESESKTGEETNYNNHKPKMMFFGYMMMF